MSEPGRILLVEDEDIIAIIIRELLEAKGFQVTVCGNCALAWHQLQNNMAGFDVIVLDRGLPDTASRTNCGNVAKIKFNARASSRSLKSMP